jgi:hypothetical protein
MTRQTDQHTGHHHDSNIEAKISDEFAERLAAMPRNQRLRAIVLPAPYMVRNGNGASRPTDAERQAIIRETRHRIEETFAEIDAVLAETGGRRLSANGNALGFIAVETTAGGIEAICDLDWVGTVLEDQPIYSLHQSNPSNPRPDAPGPHPAAS